jgi:RNA polymerase subunit RPABC4/transcription elongation factor Spt4
MDYRFVNVDAFALLCRDLKGVDQKLNWTGKLVIIVGASSRIAHFWWVELANRNPVLLCFIGFVMGLAQSI